MIVIKLGGAAGIDAAPLLDELAAMNEPWVLVHGGNQELDRVQEALGNPPEFITSPSGHVSRRTTSETIDAIRMVYRGKLNGHYVTELQTRGVNAIGLSGVDGGLLRAKRKPALRAMVDGKKTLIRDDYTGTLTEVNVELLQLLIGAGYRPVITIPALAEDCAVNVDGDRAAAMIAAALGAPTLLNLSNVPGLLRDINDSESLIRTISAQNLESADQYAHGRFKKKIMGAGEAITDGVGRVILATANHETPIANALAGNGTVIA